MKRTIIFERIYRGILTMIHQKHVLQSCEISQEKVSRFIEALPDEDDETASQYNTIIRRSFCHGGLLFPVSDFLSKEYHLCHRSAKNMLAELHRNRPSRCFFLFVGRVECS